MTVGEEMDVTLKVTPPQRPGRMVVAQFPSPSRGSPGWGEVRGREEGKRWTLLSPWRAGRYRGEYSSGGMVWQWEGSVLREGWYDSEREVYWGRDGLTVRGKCTERGMVWQWEGRVLREGWYDCEREVYLGRDGMTVRGKQGVVTPICTILTASTKVTIWNVYSHCGHTGVCLWLISMTILHHLSTHVTIVVTQCRNAQRFLFPDLVPNGLRMIYLTCK